MKKWKNDNDSETIIWTEKLFSNRPLNSEGFTVCYTVSLSYGFIRLPFSRSHGSFFIAHGFTNFAWIFPNTQFLWKQAQAAHSNTAEGHISSMINKNKAGNCSSPSLSWALLFIILVKTHVMAVSHTVDFCPWRFSSWSFKSKAVICNNIHTTFW